jgi:hypothetical protein
MKRTIIVLAGLLLLAACKKDDITTTNPTTNPTPTPTTTNGIDGNWTLTVYDNTAVTAPMAGTLKGTATTTTDGTVKFDITFDGSTHKTEEDSYTISASNTKIVFTKTAGDYNVLSGGGTWTIDLMNATTLNMTSSVGLTIKMTK